MIHSKFHLLFYKLFHSLFHSMFHTHGPTRYENEIDLLQALQGNDHIITLVGWERKSNPAVLYIVMECGDADLCTALKNRKKSGLSIDENCQRLYWQQMLEAVQAIHAVNIVHSDLKPANFIFVKGKSESIFARTCRRQHRNFAVRV